MLHLSVPTNQQGSQDAVNDARRLFSHKLAWLGVRGGHKGYFSEVG